MTTITIYDTDAERIEKIAERWNLEAHEIIEALLDNVEEDEEVYIFK